jgi:hypothetical protein
MGTPSVRLAFPRLGPGQPRQPAHHPQVLLAGLRVVQRGELAGEADPAADGRALAAHVEPGHPGPPGVRLGERGQDAHGRGLARSVRPEEGEHAGRAAKRPVEGSSVRIAQCLQRLCLCLSGPGSDAPSPDQDGIRGIVTA